MKSCLSACAVLFLASSLGAQPPVNYSLHGEQEAFVFPPVLNESPAKGASATKDVSPEAEKSDWMVLGYVQSDTPRWGYHWHSLTHIALGFTNFDSTGALTNATSSVTNRSILYKPDGIADRNGVKVLMTVRNSGFTASILNTVMNDTGLMDDLAEEIAAYVNDPSDNIAGVNLDFEPHPYGAGVGQGIVDFIVILRSKLDAGKSISYYIGPQYSLNNYPDLVTAAQHLDYFNFSCYPWSGSWSSTSTSINPIENYADAVDDFLSNGVPPEKMVLTLGTYGHRMDTNTNEYGATKNFSIGSIGFADAKYKTSLASSTAVRQYEFGAESPWYAFQTGGTYEHVVYEDEYSLEIKMRNAQSWIGSTNSGAKLGGVGFWSLAWLGKNFLGGFESHDLESDSTTDKIRTYPHIYQQMQEIFAAPGTTEFLLENWEYYDAAIGSSNQSLWDRWRDPSEGNDKAGISSVTRSIVSVPAGAGVPENSDYCAQLSFTFTTTANNRFFYRWEILGDHEDTTTPDRNATRGFFPRNAKVKLDIQTPAAYAGRTVSMIFMDGQGELEKGPAFSLNTSGWRTIETDLANDSFTGYTTTFAQYANGDGVIDILGLGNRDVAFIGLLVEGGGTAGSGQLHIDQLRWTRSTVSGIAYKINEISYREDDAEFIEVHGTQGVIPAGTEVHVSTSSDGALYNVFDLSGLTIPPSGLLVIGDPSVSNVASSTGFGALSNDLPNTTTSGVQIYNSATGDVYDSLVYRAHGGIGMLVRTDTHGVTTEGYPWLGEIAGAYSFGRPVDGEDTNFNYEDFSVLPSTPGLANASLFQSLPVTYDFDTVLPGASAFLTYDWASGGVRTPGVTPSGNGNDVYRVADSVGGNIAFFTDPIQLADAGYTAEGEFYIPTSAESAQGMGVGICGTLGSTFFTNSPAGSGYENGYWLIYNNNSGVTLNHGLGNHSQTFKFVMAQNNNMSSEKVVEIASATLAATGATAGQWTSFLLEIDPISDLLRAEINDVVIYNGTIPEGGRTSGAFQAGHRKASGSVASSEGLWLDALTLKSLPSSVDQWQILD